ncbi:hypothetical protein ACWGQ2_01510 [Arthrobacter sp. NPDC055585]
MILRPAALPFLAAALAIRMVVAAGGEGEGDLGGGGTVEGRATYYQDPSTGVWGTFQTGLAEDPMQYKYEAACFDDNDGDVSCFVRYGLECSAGPDGRLVWWSSALRADENPEWTRMSEVPTCIYSEDPAAFQERLREAVLTAFQEAPIAPGTMTLQPSPHTLIGANTNVYVEASSQVFEMELLGQSIRIEVEPTEYTFDYGDGTNYGPVSTPGGPLPEARWGEQTETSHMYSQTGDFPVAVTTFFSGEYSVNGGPMIPMDGRAEVASPSQVLSVWRSESRNVADNCLVNPAGVGC